MSEFHNFGRPRKPYGLSLPPGQTLIVHNVEGELRALLLKPPNKWHEVEIDLIHYGLNIRSGPPETLGTPSQLRPNPS